MLRGILFNDDKYFESINDDNLMDVLTENTIILCEDTEIKNFLYHAIIDICDGKHIESGYDYYIEDTDYLNYKYGINYLPTTELNIDTEQKITFTIEAPYILTATSPKDIWFAQRTKENKIRIYPLRVFKGYKERWEQGVYKIYIDTIAGRYGNYKYGNILKEKIGE